LALAGAFLFAANKLACECGKQKKAKAHQPFQWFEMAKKNPNTCVSGLLIVLD
jgi:hypothetical protein